MSADVWALLKKPFSFDEIEIKPQTVSPDKGSALAVPYFDARAVMNRLDEVFTPAGWRTTYREIHLEGGKVGMLCRLEAKDPASGEWVVREDGSETSDIEAFKGAISGALKRAFSALGNRHLYDVDLGWQPCEFYTDRQGKQRFSKWTKDALKAMRKKYEASDMQRTQVEEEPERPAVSPVIEAGQYIKSIGMTTEEFNIFKEVKGKANWVDAALRAKAEGITDKGALLGEAA